MNLTDNHLATKNAKQYFKKAVGLYAGAFVDVSYDHFLANDINEFTAHSLSEFAAATYLLLEANKAIMPDRFSNMLPYMQHQDWLSNYRNISGAEKSFAGLVRRSAYLQTSALAFNAFLDNYEPINPVMKNFSRI